MTKAEILEAINATIVPNGVKGITAESLANILTEIVNSTPEGGSGGAGGAYIDMTLIDPDSPSMELTPEAIAHNADLYTSICEVLNNGGVLPPVSVNASMGLGLYASCVLLEGDLLMFCFHAPVGGDVLNYFVSATTKEGTSEALMIGGDLTLMVLYLPPTGEVMTEIPGL